MKRRDFLKGIGLGFGLAGGLGGINGCLPRPKRQNVILVTMDTTRRDHLGCYGYRLPTSPNIDALAREAIVFEHCYSTTNITLPSHASILTGLHLHNHGVLDQPIWILYPEITTLSSLLAAHGYNTGAVTSVSFMNKKTIGNGFQRFHAPEQAPERTAAETTDVAISFLATMQLTSAPFFLWLHYYDPHFSYAAPGKYSDMFLKEEIDPKRLEFITTRLEGHGNVEYDELDDLEEVASRKKLSEKEQRAMVSRYDGEIAYMDHHVGRFVDALKDRGFYENTVMVITADHGEMFFENDDDWLGHSLIYEPAVRIPLIMRNPLMEPSRVKGLVQSIDIAPTLLNWLGLEAPQMDGKNVNPLILGDRGIREELYLTEAGARFVGIVSGRHKMRMPIAGTQKTPLVPPSWIDELEKLPRIQFDPEPPLQWDYDATKGIIVYSWKHPSGCSDKIDRFAIELVSRMTCRLDQAKAVTVEEVDGRTTWATILGFLVNRRQWDSASATYCPILIRVVARNEDGRNVATSAITQLKLKSVFSIDTELYDLYADALEQHNIAADKPEIVRGLRSNLVNFGIKCLATIEQGPMVLRDRPRSPVEMSEEDIMRLKALGYVL